MSKKKQPVSAPPTVSAPQAADRRRPMAALLGLVAVLLYANTFFNSFALDDNTVIRSNSIVARGFAGIPEIFGTPYLYGAIRSPNDLYRPLTLATFAAERQVFGDEPSPGHVINVLLFAGCVMLLFLFLDDLFERRARPLSFITALLFALHPIHTEVVANIKSRDELLCFLLGFWALRYWLGYTRGGPASALYVASAAFALSLLSKETSFCFVILLPLLFFLWERAPRRRCLIVSGSAAGVAVLVLVVRFWVLSAYGANHPFAVPLTENALAGATNVGERFATATLGLGHYIRLLVVPYPLRCDYSYNTIPLTNFSDWRALLSALIYLALVACAGLLLRRGRSVYALSILCYLLPLALVSNLFFLVGASLAERFLFFPSVGFCLAAGQLLIRMSGAGSLVFASKKLYMLLAPIALGWAIITVQRNAIWRDERTLYSVDFGHTPRSYRLPYYLASVALNEANETTGDSAGHTALLSEALGYLRQSIAIYPHFAVTQSQAGLACLGLGMYDSAEHYTLNALALHSRDTFARNNLAAAYFRQGRYQESIAQCRINLSLYPGYARAYTNIGVSYLKLGKPDSALPVLRKALVLEPDNGQTAYFISVANGMAGVLSHTDSATVVH